MSENVNLRITYKGLTLLLGIFVAVIVAVTVWVSLAEAGDFGENIHLIPARSIRETIYRSVVATMQFLTL